MKCLSRMSGNVHVRFLEGKEGASPPTSSACDKKSRRELLVKATLSVWGNPTTTCVAGNGGVGNLWDNVGNLIA